MSFEGGMYYFRVGKSPRIALGRSYPIAMAKYGELMAPEPGVLRTMGDVFDRYLKHVTPKKKSKSDYYSVKPLRIVFGHMLPHEIKPRHCYAYLAERTKTAPGGALNEMGFLSTVMTECVEWGLVEANVCFQVSRKKYVRPPRDRYVTDEEFAAVYDRAGKRIQVAMDLAVLTGLRRGDILGLTRDNLTHEGILVKPGKTEGSSGKTILILWSDELRAVVGRAKQLTPQVRKPLLCNRAGQAYSGDGFSANWQRLIRKTHKEGAIAERFEFKDLRAKSATDDDVLEDASGRLGHSNIGLTKRVYIRKPTRVKPLR
jgi:integrase